MNSIRIDDTAMVLLALSRSQASRPSEQVACIPTAHSMAARHAIQRRRPGPRSTSITIGACSVMCPFADPNAMLDPTCPILPAACWMHCAHSVTISRTGGSKGHRISGRIAGAGRQLVWTLGRQLHLRQPVSRCAGFRRPGQRPRALHPTRARMGAFHSELRRRLGRKLRQLQSRCYVPAGSTPSQTAWRFWSLWQAETPPAAACRMASITWSGPQNDDGTWD